MKCLGCSTAGVLEMATKRSLFGLFVHVGHEIESTKRERGPLSAAPANSNTLSVAVGAGGSTAGVIAIVHFGSVGRLWGLFERSKAT